MSKILFTGGGSAGHVTPNLALMEIMGSRGWQLVYVGSETGIERELVAEMGVPYFPIKTGKLRRYFSWANFIDPFLIVWGLLQSIWICYRQRPAVVFSKGGFVSVPVVLAAWLTRTPVIAHESDVSPGLATRLCLPFCQTLCVNFEESRQLIGGKEAQVVVTGSPVRQDILKGDAQRGKSWLGLSDDKPVLLVFGGSLGAESINTALRGTLESLTKSFQVVHVCGAGRLLEVDQADHIQKDYIQKEYIQKEFGDVLACADLVVSRAGANAIYELLLVRVPHLLIPLPLKASRGDQILNASTFAAAGYSRVLEEEELTPERLEEAILSVWTDREALTRHLSSFEIRDALSEIVKLIEDAAG